jgi:hypothetical protein
MGATVGFGLLASGGLGVAVHLALNVAPVAPGAWLGVAVIGVLGLGCGIVAAAAKRYDVACPKCGQALSLDDDTDHEVVCMGCTGVVGITGGRAARLPDDLQAPGPDFGLLILPRMKVPALCAACGAEATRSSNFVAKDHIAGATAMALVGSLLSGSLALVWGSAKTSGGVPYCDAHDAAHEVVSNEGSFTLWVKSWAFLRAVREANPGMLLSFSLKRPGGKSRSFG